MKLSQSCLRPDSSEASQTASEVAAYPPDTMLHIYKTGGFVSDAFYPVVHHVIPCEKGGCGAVKCWRAGDWLMEHDEFWVRKVTAEKT